MQLLAAYVTFVRHDVNVFETDPHAVNDESDHHLKAVSVRFTIPPRSPESGPYNCQITVLGPTGNRTSFILLACAGDDCAVVPFHSKAHSSGPSKIYGLNLFCA